MQESYISLNPEHAERMSKQAMRAAQYDRVYKAFGGDAGAYFAGHMGFTASLCSYTFMRRRGFRMLPFTAAKMPVAGGVIGAYMMGHYVGSYYSAMCIGAH